MGFVSDPYTDVVAVYVSQLRQDSLRAAAAIEQIQVKVGSKAALRAALIVTIFSIEVKQNHWVPDIGVYAYLLHEYPEAIPRLEYAMSCCLHDWGIRNVELARIQVSDVANPDASHIWRQRNRMSKDGPEKPGSELYDDIVPAYIGLIKEDSPEAADAVAGILSSLGSRAALRATLVLALLKMEVQTNRSVENPTVQTQLMNEFPQALSLLERAITSCLQVWGSLLVGQGISPTAVDVESIQATPSIPQDDQFLAADKEA